MGEKEIIGENEINEKIKSLNETDGISDGYHTFGELYKHRIHLFIALCKSLNKNYVITKSRFHDDGSELEGWFIIQIEHKYALQISYHLPDSYWDICDFIETVDKAGKRDGHTSDDVLERLLKI